MRRILGWAVVIGGLGVGSVWGQGQVLLRAEQFRAQLHRAEQAIATEALPQGAAQQLRAGPQFQLDSLFAAQEARLPGTGYARLPSVKAPPGAPELLRHERHAIVDYFIGRKMLHVFVIDRKETHYRVLPMPDDLLVQMADLRSSLAERKMTAEGFRRASHRLYTVLLAPLEDLLVEMDQLTVVRDYRMAAFPFGVLVQSELGPANFRTLRYLLRDYAVGYAHSVEHLAAAAERKRVDREVAAVYSPGGFSAGAVPGLDAHWEVVSASEVGAEGLRIAWVQGTDAAVWAADLWGERPVDLVVADWAWQPGGEPAERDRRGMELVYRWQRSGVKSVVIPAWRGSEGVGTEVLRYFLAALVDRQYTDQSLRYAKMEYLTQAEEGRTHPGYWANWQLYDDFGPLRAQPNFPWYVFLVGAFLLVVVLGRRL
ncbi:MAG: CHAT domain-containing protein [Bacteroidota bacterium]